MSKLDLSSIFNANTLNYAPNEKKSRDGEKNGLKIDINSKEPPQENENENNFEDIKAFNQLEREGRLIRSDAERVKAICSEYQKNGRIAQRTKVEILKGLKAGEDITSLFLKACECISAMTGEELFASQSKGDVLTIYGKGLKQPEPLQILLKETNDRLERLKEAKKRNQNSDENQRIESAIIAHENEVNWIKKELSDDRKV